jgi:organic radical activating enzyme
MLQTATTTQALPLMEHFYTIQGEGANTGQAAYFLRLGGCDVGCVWCDVKESWDADAHPKVAIAEMVKWIKDTPAPNVVITGGEPLMHDLTELTAELKAAGLKVWIETSGSSPMSGEYDWVCLSPKKFKAPLPEVLMQADELKIVVFNKSDFDWANQHAAKVKADCKLYLQPEWTKEKEMLPLIVEFVKAHPQWQISLQTHKYMAIP